MRSIKGTFLICVSLLILLNYLCNSVIASPQAALTIKELQQAAGLNNNSEYDDDLFYRTRLISVKVKIYNMHWEGEKNKEGKWPAGVFKMDLIAEMELITLNGKEGRIVHPTEVPGLDIEMIAAPKALRDGNIMTPVKLKLLVKDEKHGYYPIKEINTISFIKNGGIQKLGGCMADISGIVKDKIRSETNIIIGPHIVDYGAIRCEDTPWIDKLNAELVGDTDVKLDWMQDVPLCPNGLQNYRIYRDTKPIDYHSITYGRKPFTDKVSGDATSWIDYTEKEQGKTYYYAVTAVNHSGSEQSGPPVDRNAVIRIPKQTEKEHLP